jgi:hypothetical protein
MIDLDRGEKACPLDTEPDAVLQLIVGYRLNTLGFSPSGKPVLYYHLDVQSTTPAPVYILYREGEDAPVQHQVNIIDTLPGEKGYDDFQQIWKVSVPNN